MDLNSLKRDTEAVEDGEWVDEIPEMGDLRLKVRGLTSAASINLKAEKERAIPLDQRNRDGSIKTSTAMEITRELFAEAILLDWENLSMNGEELKYTPETAADLLSNPDFTPFADAVAWASRYVDRKRIDNQEVVAGN